jgi:N-hydroxyarylamine O-acetyltransferase
MPLDRSAITDAYLKALGLTREAPSLALLSQIARRHVATFSFGSIGPRLGDSLPLDLPSLYDRIVVRKRGGYCFEQNGLLYDVLDELGFKVTLQMARVLLNMDVNFGLTHRMTLVDIEGSRYIVDVGFGALGPRLPVNIEPGLAPPDEHKFWVAETRPGELCLHTIKDGAPWMLYRFDLTRYGPADCEIGHFYSHKHPKANFVNNLIAARKLDEEIRSLRNRDYWVLRPDGDTTHVVADAQDLRRILTQEFGFDVTDDECATLFGGMPVPVTA